MRLYWLLFLTLLSFPAIAEHIRCYSAGKQIYSGYADQVNYSDGVYFLIRNNSSKVVFINGDCVGNFTPPDEDEKS